MNNKDIQEVKLETILVVKEFLENFSEELIILPLDKELEFIIDSTPSSAPIPQAPYSMALLDLKELMVQLYFL